MKKLLVLGMAILMIMALYVVTFASVPEQNVEIHKHIMCTPKAHGAHCSGTVGCSCPGFSPITNGDVWQQAYCKYCNHKRSYHK